MKTTYLSSSDIMPVIQVVCSMNNLISACEVRSPIFELTFIEGTVEICGLDFANSDTDAPARSPPQCSRRLAHRRSSLIS